MNVPRLESLQTTRVWSLRRIGPALTLLWIAACGALFVYGAGRLTRSWTGWDPRAAFETKLEFVRAVEYLDLELDFSAPPRVVGVARLRLREGARGRLTFVLNRALRIDDARDENGRAIEHAVVTQLPSDFFRESAAHSFELGDGARELVISYSGRGADGGGTSDWMGILLAAGDELRMSPQSAFYPQIPIDLSGPDVVAWPTTLRARIPAGFEAHAPGVASPPRDEDNTRVVCFTSTRPIELSFFAAERVRREISIGDARVVTLLRENRASLAESIASDIESMLRVYTRSFGAIEAQSLGVVEFVGRGDNYNWASQEIVALESSALSSGLVREKLAHEVAHLWWGQDTPARGRGERLLTEGLAEWSSWRAQAELDPKESVERFAQRARERAWASVHETGIDAACADVRFALEGYSSLAYDKCPAALATLERALGTQEFDAVLRRYRELARAAPPNVASLETFAAALRASPNARTVDLRALELAGHLHAELAEVRFEGERVRGRLVAQPCAAEIAAPKVQGLVVKAFTAGGSVSAVVEVGATFELSAASTVEGVTLKDLDALPFVRCDPVLAPGVGFVACEPPDGSRDLPLGPVEFHVRFGRELEPPSLSWIEGANAESSARARDSKFGHLRVRAAERLEDAHTLRIRVDETSPGREHVLVLPAGLRTTRGLTLARAEIRFAVRDAGDTPRPRIVRSTPADGATQVARTLAEVRFEFSEPMRLRTGFRTSAVRELRARGLNYPPLGVHEWRDPRTLVWRFDTPLEANTHYALPFDDQFVSALGLKLEPLEFDFTTAP